MTNSTTHVPSEAQRVTAADAKTHLSSLVSRVAYGGERFVIERRGKPLAALVPVSALRSVQTRVQGVRPRLGALALVGAWGDMSDSEIDAMAADIYAARERDRGRSVELEA